MTAKGKKQNIVINTEVLNKHLSKRKWTYYRLEKETGLPKQTIYRLANTGSISYKNLLIISDALGITTDKLTKGATLPDDFESSRLLVASLEEKLGDGWNVISINDSGQHISIVLNGKEAKQYQKDLLKFQKDWIIQHGLMPEKGKD